MASTLLCHSFLREFKRKISNCIEYIISVLLQIHPRGYFGNSCLLHANMHSLYLNKTR